VLNCLPLAQDDRHRLADLRKLGTDMANQESVSAGLPSDDLEPFSDRTVEKFDGGGDVGTSSLPNISRAWRVRFRAFDSLSPVS
jgi:hypothetical protein